MLFQCIVVIAVISGAISLDSCASAASAEGAAEHIPVALVEPVNVPAAGAAGATGDQLKTYRRLASADPRVAKATSYLDNEAARFIRTLLAAGRQAIPVAAADGGWPGELVIALQPGGNHARLGLAVQPAGEGGAVGAGATAGIGPTAGAPSVGAVQLPRMPYVELDLTSDRLSATLLHEGGHVAHYLARRNITQHPAWTPLPHTTFAVTDRQTALSEGYAIHFETLWGHFGKDPGRQGFYYHDTPGFGPDTGFAGEFFFPVRDMLTYSQNWARYQGVRDGLAAFQGHVYAGDYVRSQLDPARDVSRLKGPGEMLASEGLVAAYCFRLAAWRAAMLGARRGGGLDQSGLLRAEIEVLQGLRAAHDEEGPGADLLDLVRATARHVPQLKDGALAIFVDLTRGVTADRAVQGLWRDLYSASTAMDMARVQALALDLQSRRARIYDKARTDPATLGDAVGPIVPVQVATASSRLGDFQARPPMVHLVVFGDPFAVEFDLNAAGPAEWAIVPGLSADERKRIEAEAARGPFLDLPNFWRRTGLQASEVGLSTL